MINISQTTKINTFHTPTISLHTHTTIMTCSAICLPLFYGGLSLVISSGIDFVLMRMGFDWTFRLPMGVATFVSCAYCSPFLMCKALHYFSPKPKPKERILAGYRIININRD